MMPSGSPNRSATWPTNTVTKGPCKTRRFERQPNLEDYYCYKAECPGPFLPLSP